MIKEGKEMIFSQEDRVHSAICEAEREWQEYEHERRALGLELEGLEDIAAKVEGEILIK